MELDNSASEGGVSKNEGHSLNISLALDSRENAHIAWQDDSGGGYEIYYVFWNGNTWSGLGDSNTGGGISKSQKATSPSLAVDLENRPHIAWRDVKVGNAEIYYSYWNGSQWTARAGSTSGGGVSNTPLGSFEPSLKLDSSGKPHIAWNEYNKIHYAYWNESEWVGLGESNSGAGILASSALAARPSLALDSQNRPHIAWFDKSDGDSEIYYSYWDGSVWKGIGASNEGGGISKNDVESNYPSLDIDNNDRPVIAWTDELSGVDEIYLTRWNGAQWVGLGESMVPGGLSHSGEAATKPALVLDQSGNPHVAWFNKANGVELIYYLYWNGSKWMTRGTQGEIGRPNLDQASFRPALALDDLGLPCIAWQFVSFPSKQDVYFSRWGHVP